MTKEPQQEPITFEDDNLTDIHISDEDLELEDRSSKLAKKKARKLAKAAMSPDERRAHQKKKVLAITGAIILVILIVLAIPYSRWFTLNLFGFRSTMQFKVLETQEKSPISNVSILLDGEYFTTTDTEGHAQFENVKLGKHSVTVQKNGYSKEQIVIKNDIDGSETDLAIKSVGIKVNLDVRNWLTNEPVGGATVSLGKDTVSSDKNGRASIIVPPESSAKTVLQIAAPGHRTQSVPVTLSVESKEVALVSDVKNFFISRREGKYDIYSSYVDGSSQQRLIEATGKEDLDLMQLTLHRGNRFGILVANREGKIVNGRVVAGIYVIDTTTASIRKIDEGSDVRLLEWGDDVLVYQKTSTTLNYDDPAFTQLYSFNPLNNKQRQIAQANYFSVSLVAQNKLFYAAADGYREEANSALTSIDLSNNAQKTYLEGKLPTSLSRSNFDTLTMQANDNNYYSIQVKAGSTRQIDRRVDVPLRYALSPSGQQTVWIEKRDGQGTVLTRSVSRDDTRVVAKLSGLINPSRFITDRYIVARVVTTTETADYLIDLPTGKTAKIADVTDVQTIATSY